MCVHGKLIELAVQVDGKTRGTVAMPRSAPLSAVRARVENDRNLQRYLAGKRIVREIYVPGRIFSLVTEQTA